MIKKQWQLAIDCIEQFRGTATGDLYTDIIWNGNPIAELELIEKYAEIKRSLWDRELIEHRNKLLSESDWTQNRDVNLVNDIEWQQYRQKLRDITTTIDPYVEEVVWPPKPQSI